ncbi:MAG: CopG family transcriptional regulator [Candidatus Bipolaricaulis sp.]|nr:CopG family transcriptional regulator [Candidatus Bipolaricaulis sp.]
METTQKRATVYLNPAVYWALRLKLDDTDQTMSDLVHEAVKLSLLEDAEDLSALDEWLPSRTSRLRASSRSCGGVARCEVLIKLSARKKLEPSA